MYTILFLPFIQLGVSYYISIQTVAFLTLLKHYRLKVHVVQVSLVFFVFFNMKYLYEPLILHDVLVTMREFIFFLVIALSTYGFKKINLEKTIDYLKILLILLFVVILVQKISIVFLNQFPRIPIDLFVMNQETLKGIEGALEFQTRIRPVAFYGEPSYASGIIVISYFLINKFNAAQTKKYELLAVISVFLLESMSGIIIMLFLLVSKYSGYILKKKFIFPLLFSITIIFFMILSSELAGRMLSILQGNADLSTQIRLIYPVIAIYESFRQFHLFGIANTSLELYSQIGSIRDNGTLNLIMDYGLFILLIFAYIYRRINDKNLFILFLLMSFLNGSVFSLDKVVLFSLLLGINKSIIYSQIKRKNLEN